MWNSTLFNILTFDEDVWDCEWNSEMQQYVLAALPYRVQSWKTLPDSKWCIRMAEITRQITMPITMPITIPNRMPNLLRSHITKNPIQNNITTQTRRSCATNLQSFDDYKSTLELTPNQALPIDIPYKAVWDWSLAEECVSKEWDDCTGIAIPTANNCHTWSAGMKYQHDNKERPYVHRVM